MLNIGVTRFGKAPGMRVKSADDFLAKNPGCPNDLPDIQARKRKAARATKGIARSHETKVTASGNNQPAKLPTVASVRGIARLAQGAAVLVFVEHVHCRADT